MAMDTVSLQRYETLSPFEIKNDLATVGHENRPRPRRSPT